MTTFDAPPDIDIHISDRRWCTACPGLETRVTQTIMSAQAQYCPHSFNVLSLLLCDDTFMRGLNHKYRGKDQPTNVLAFPVTCGAGPGACGEGFSPVLGDIAIAYDRVKQEAHNKGVSIGAHLSHLLVHGYLHLQGMDHQTDTQAGAMEALEIKILAHLGISNPYGMERS